MKKVLVVTNFNAGRKKAIKYKKYILEFLLKNSESFKFITIDELDINQNYNCDTIIALGGDGTVNKILSLAQNQNATLGIIPCGTANLFASKLNISTNLKKAVENIRKGNIKKVDLCKINDKLMILRLGLGYDSDIICKTPQSLKNKLGYFSYFVAGILFGLRLKLKEIKFTINQKDFKENASCFIVANSANMYRNWISVSKNSQLDDGKLDIFILSAKNPIIFFFEFLKIIFNVKNNSSKVKYFQTNEIEIENKLLTCHIDGEKVKINGNIHCEIIPECLKVFVP